MVEALCLLLLTSCINLEATTEVDETQAAATVETQGTAPTLETQVAAAPAAETATETSTLERVDPSLGSASE